MEFIKKILQWLVMGLCLGVGFTVASFIVSYYAVDFYAESMEERMNEEYPSGVEAAEPMDPDEASSDINGWAEARSYREFDADSGLAVVEHRGSRVGSDFRVIGTLENRGTGAWKMIGVEVELFDADGNFVEECSDYLNVTLRPEETENFVVSCGSCREGPLPEFEDYEIVVSSAMFQGEAKRNASGREG